MNFDLRRFACLLALAVAALPSQAAESVHVLSYRGAEVVGPLFERFTAETGIAVRLEVLGAEAIGPALLAARSEAGTSPDLVLSVDALRFSDYAAQGLLRPLPADALAAVPTALRDPDGQWLGLSYRLRGPLYAHGTQADADWPALLAALPQRRVCHRDPAHVYAIGTLAWLHQAAGKAMAEAFANEVLASAPRIEGGDRDQILAVLDGRCDLAFVNHYYLARLMASADAAEAAAAARLQFGFAGTGEPLIGNVSAIALPQGGAHREAADRLAVWLTDAAALELHARIFDEFPAGWPQRELQLPQSVQPFSRLRMGPPLPDRVAGSQAWAQARVAELLQARSERP